VPALVLLVKGMDKLVAVNGVLGLTSDVIVEGGLDRVKCKLAVHFLS